MDRITLAEEMATYRNKLTEADGLSRRGLLKAVAAGAAASMLPPSVPQGLAQKAATALLDSGMEPDVMAILGDLVRVATLQDWENYGIFNDEVDVGFLWDLLTHTLGSSNTVERFVKTWAKVRGIGPDDYDDEGNDWSIPDEVGTVSKEDGWTQHVADDEYLTIQAALTDIHDNGRDWATWRKVLKSIGHTQRVPLMDIAEVLTKHGVQNNHSWKFWDPMEDFWRNELKGHSEKAPLKVDFKHVPKGQAPAPASGGPVGLPQVLTAMARWMGTVGQKAVDVSKLGLELAKGQGSGAAQDAPPARLSAPGPEVDLGPNIDLTKRSEPQAR